MASRIDNTKVTTGGGYVGGGVDLQEDGDGLFGGDVVVDGTMAVGGAATVTGAMQVVGFLRPWSLWIPANQFVTASGSPSQATWTGGSAAKQTAWFLDGAVSEELATTFLLPAGYTGQTITIEILWTGDSAGSGVVRWITRGNVSADGGALALAYNSDVDDTYQGADITHIATVTTTESTGRAMCLSIGRRGDHANDTLTQDAAFLGVRVSIL